jgi:HlyD family secretion protein
VLSALAAVLAAVVAALAPINRSASPLEGVRTATVRRADLDAEVLAAGSVESSQSAEIRCTLERLDVPGQGEGLAVGGASTILSLIPDGSTVKEGDVLCELDSSGYQELVRQQKILVEQAQAHHRQAALVLEVARIALRSYSQGERLQVEQQFRGQIALGQSDLARQADRLVWLRRMLAKGYSSAAQVAGEELSLKRSQVTLAQTFTASRSFQRYTVPKDLRFLRSQVVGAQATLDSQSIRLKQEEERLRHYESLLDRCTVRAPHDGFVIYANRPGRSPQVYTGATVRERMRLFYLPDLSKMEVALLLHETMVDRVRPGMAARVRVEAVPGGEMEGRVVSISEFPLTDNKSETGNDVTYFLCRVRLENLLAGLRPGMSAEATIATVGRRGVLAVPPAAVAIEDGQEICYVARQDHLERRTVELGQSTTSLLEVIRGLEEGEEIVLDPALVHSGSSRASTLR